jgi:hypothetical protein
LLRNWRTSAACDKTGNGTIDLSFEHLAAPKDIDSSLSTYVVWAQINGKDPFKLGVVDYDEDKRTGELSATYSAENFTLMMTVEQDPNVGAPTGVRVLEIPSSHPTSRIRSARPNRVWLTMNAGVIFQPRHFYSRMIAVRNPASRAWISSPSRAA